jgi:methyl-accepting chemotaxis protein
LKIAKSKFAALSKKLKKAAKDRLKMAKAQIKALEKLEKERDERIAEIARAAREETQGIRQISGAVSQIESITQGNAAAAEESAAALQQIRSEAEVLRQAIVEIRGGKAAAQAAPVRA